MQKPKLSNKRLRWQDICPSCIKYDYPDHQPECKHCQERGITESILCSLTRMDQEEDQEDFRCDAFQAKHLVQ